MSRVSFLPGRFCGEAHAQYNTWQTDVCRRVKSPRLSMGVG